MSVMTATHHRSQMMRNFGIREADLTSLEITITEEINPSAINTKWETAIAKAVGGYSPWTIVPMEERRTSAVIKATLARDRLLRTMEICGHIPRWEPPVIQAAPALDPSNSAVSSGSSATGSSSGPSAPSGPSKPTPATSSHPYCEKPTNGTANPQEWGTIQKASKAGEDSRRPTDTPTASARYASRLARSAPRPPLPEGRGL